MKQLIICVSFLCLNQTNLFAQSQSKKIKADSANWSISIGFGLAIPTGLTIMKLNTKYSSFFEMKVQRGFSSFIGFYANTGLSRVKFSGSNKDDVQRNQIPMFYYGAGLCFNFSQSRIQPFISFGPGVVSYHKSLFSIPESNNNPGFKNFETNETGGTFFQLGIGLGLSAMKGFGFRLEWNNTWFQYPGDLANGIEPQTLYVKQLGIGVSQRF